MAYISLEEFEIPKGQSESVNPLKIVVLYDKIYREN
jgi:hypothetical protein